MEDHEKGVGLRLVGKIQPQRGVVAALHARCGAGIAGQPADQVEMRIGVVIEAHGGRHVDDSVDEFRLLEVRHRIIAPLEFVARETIACLKRRGFQ